jgi:predicted hydrocarbon binding protein
MIGDFKGEVKYKVVTALLQAYQDILDYDGLKSILKEAEMLHLKNIKYEDQNQNLDFFSFKKIISAQNCLLYESSKLLFEIGKKLSFYLFPYGISFDEIINEINSLIDTEWKVEILENLQKEISVKVHRCIFCSEVGVPCDMFKGFLVHSLEKSLPSDYKVLHYTDTEKVYDPDHNTFILKLKIKKKY